MELRGIVVRDVAQTLTTRRAVSPAAQLVMLAVVAFAVRWTMFGYPFAEFDEQFYLLAGDRMLHGALPYIDIWDRKPVGLFVIYAAIRMAGGDGVVQYHLAATAVVVGTAWMIRSYALRLSGQQGALIAALSYILWLNLASGEGGQSPVFYNPLMLGAAMIVARGLRDDDRLRSRGCAAMLLAGLAMQIKYTALFEGVFLGCTLLWTGWYGGRRGALMLDAALWIGCAVVPTLLALGAYWRMGHVDDFVFANFVSILQRGHHPAAIVIGRFAALCAILAPLVWLAGAGWRERAPGLRFVQIWLAASIIGVIAFGTWFDHYALPVVAPAAIAAAPVMNRKGLWRAGVIATLLIALMAGQIILSVKRGKRGDLAVGRRLLTAMSGSRNCPYIYDGQPVLYLLGHQCLPTRWPFPSHINFASERDADGMITAVELRRILSYHPDRIMTREPAFALENQDSRSALYAELGRDYRLIERVPTSSRSYAVYALRAGILPLPNAQTPVIAQPAPNIQPPRTSLGQ